MCDTVNQNDNPKAQLEHRPLGRNISSYPSFETVYFYVYSTRIHKPSWELGLNFRDAHDPPIFDGVRCKSWMTNHLFASMKPISIYGMQWQRYIRLLHARWQTDQIHEHSETHAYTNANHSLSDNVTWWSSVTYIVYEASHPTCRDHKSSYNW